MILCVGTTPSVQRSMKFSGFTLDEVNRAVSVSDTAAGKSINAARVLNRLGVDVLATGFLGGDTGEFLRCELDHEHIRHQFISVPFRTRTCTTIMDQGAGTTTELVEESEVVPERCWQELLDLVAAQMPRCHMLLLSGSLPPRSPQDFYARCCAIAQKNNVPAILDARGEPLRLAMPYKPVMVKPNRSELASTFGFDVTDDNHLKTAIRQLISLGTKSALITMGARGAVLSDGTDFWFLQAPKVETDNPIGSGDSVAAGFAAGMLQQLPLLDCAILGIACGSANAMTPTPGIVHKEDVERLKTEIKPQPF